MDNLQIAIDSLNYLKSINAPETRINVFLSGLSDDLIIEILGL